MIHYLTYKCKYADFVQVYIKSRTAAKIVRWML